MEIYLQDAYAELVKLAVERRARLEESRKLWQFYWDMADEENWIKEKEQILSTGDIGHDLTTIHLLISKHRALEEDIASHEPALYSVVNVGEELIQQEHFGNFIGYFILFYLIFLFNLFFFTYFFLFFFYILKIFYFFLFYFIITLISRVLRLPLATTTSITVFD